MFCYNGGSDEERVVAVHYGDGSVTGAFLTQIL